jgi:hypothetical protein
MKRTNNRIGEHRIVQKVTLEVFVDIDIDVTHMRQSVMDALTYANNVTRDEDILIGKILSGIEKQLKP